MVYTDTPPVRTTTFTYLKIIATIYLMSKIDEATIQG